MPPRQPFLTGLKPRGVQQFGGTLIKGNPREARPISVKRPMHLVMRSSLAVKSHSFLHRTRVRQIEALCHRLGRELGVKVYQYANSGNHLHLIVLPRSRVAFHAYLRALTGLIARITMGVERGKCLDKKFWDARPYTRVITWGREFRAVALYIAQNTLEALGFVPYTPRSPRSARLASAG